LTKTGSSSKTSRRSSFSASVKRVASAVGEGSIAVQFVHELLAGEPPQAG
jgi:hypothetical protein